MFFIAALAVFWWGTDWTDPVAKWISFGLAGFFGLKGIVELFLTVQDAWEQGARR